MFPKLLLTYILSICITLCSGQLSKIESKEDALKELKKNIPDSSRQFIYNFLGLFYMSSTRHDKKEVDSAFYYLRKAVYLGDSLNLNNKEITNESLCLLAKTYIWSGDVSTAKQIFLHVIANYQTNHLKINEAKTWRRMGKDFWYNNIKSLEILNYFDSAIFIYEKKKNIAEKAEVMFDKMNFLSSIGNSVGAEKILQQLITQARDNHFEYLSQIYCMLARQNRYNGDLNKGLEYALEAIKYIDHAKNKSGVANFYGELAQIYEELGEADQSIFWYKKCIAERERTKVSLKTMYRTMSLMVIQMIKVKKEKEAITLLEELAKRKPPVTHIAKAVLAQSFAYCYTALKKYKLAEPKFLEMISEYEQGEIQQEILFIAYYDITKFYVDRNQHKKAEGYLVRMPLSGGASLPQNKDLYLLKFKIDSANGKLASAIKYYQKYKALNDTIFNEAKSKQINELMIKYESEKKDTSIKMLETNSKLQQGKLAQANQTRNWMIGVAILLFVITGLFINNSRQKQRSNSLLKKQQKEISQQNTSLKHLVNEKEWLLKEIHHRVKNNLHIVMSLLNSQSAYLENDAAIAAIHNSQHRVHAMSLIHQKLYNDENVSSINISSYIRELVAYLQDFFNTGQRINFELNIIPLELDVAQAVPLGLILNEAITNAIKHAFPDSRPGKIDITLISTAMDHYTLTITDDGIGMQNDTNSERPDSLGMTLMKGLSEDIDGSLAVEKNNGTTLRISFAHDAGIKYENNILPNSVY